MSALSFHGYLVAVGEYMKENPSQRKGQAHMNVLHKMCPDLASDIKWDSPYDCFYDDTKVGSFLMYIRENWDRVPLEE